jgi:hypothetical protein
MIRIASGPDDADDFDDGHSFDRDTSPRAPSTPSGDDSGIELEIIEAEAAATAGRALALEAHLRMLRAKRDSAQNSRASITSLASATSSVVVRFGVPPLSGCGSLPPHLS